MSDRTYGWNDRTGTLDDVPVEGFTFARLEGDADGLEVVLGFDGTATLVVVHEDGRIWAWALDVAVNIGAVVEYAKWMRAFAAADGLGLTAWDRAELALA